MVIFHSYVKLPEGSSAISAAKGTALRWSLCLKVVASWTASCFWKVIPEPMIPKMRIPCGTWSHVWSQELSKMMHNDALRQNNIESPWIAGDIYGIVWICEVILRYTNCSLLPGTSNLASPRYDGVTSARGTQWEHYEKAMVVRIG